MTRQLPVLLSLACLSAGPLAAQQVVPALKEDKPGLAAQATLSADSALHIARLRVPRGTVEGAGPQRHRRSKRGCPDRGGRRR